VQLRFTRFWRRHGSTSLLNGKPTCLTSLANASRRQMPSQTVSLLPSSRRRGTQRAISITGRYVTRPINSNPVGINVSSRPRAPPTVLRHISVLGSSERKETSTSLVRRFSSGTTLLALGYPNHEAHSMVTYGQHIRHYQHVMVQQSTGYLCWPC
jgi:hypothetical protein